MHPQSRVKKDYGTFFDSPGQAILQKAATFFCAFALLLLTGAI